MYGVCECVYACVFVVCVDVCGCVWCVWCECVVRMCVYGVYVCGVWMCPEVYVGNHSSTIFIETGSLGQTQISPVCVAGLLWGSLSLPSKADIIESPPHPPVVY